MYKLYFFNDIKPGICERTFTLDGYQYIQKGFDVNAKQYIEDDDPFGEYLAWKGQIAALIASAGGGVVQTNDDAEDTEDSGIQVTVNQISQGLYEIKTVKMSYDYSYVKTVTLVELVPLKGEITGTIKLAKFSDTYLQQNTLNTSDFVAIKDGVELWVTKTDSSVIPPVKSLYGPFVTEGGGFAISGIPADDGFTIQINNFEQGDVYYGTSTGLGFSEWAIDVSVSATVPSFIGVGTFDAGYEAPRNYQLYLFPIDGFTTITNTSDAASRVLALGGAIELTFSDPIDSNTFVYGTNYQFTAATNNKSALPTAANITELWSADGRTVKIVSDINWPYSVNGEKKISDVEFIPANPVRAKSGAILYNNGLKIPIYTPEGVKLTAVNIDPPASEIPANPRAAILVTKDAIKLTFNKNIAASSEFFVTDTSLVSNPVQWKFGATNDIVFLYTDLLPLTGATGLDFTYNVTSATDPFDSALAPTATPYIPTVQQFLGGASFTDGFKKPGENLLILRKTNIWDVPLTAPLNAGTSKYQIVSSSAARPTIEFTFDRSIPDGAQITARTDQTTTTGSAQVGGGDNTIRLDVSYNATRTTLILTPAVRLTGKPRTVTLTITTLDGQPLFNSGQLNRYDGILVNAPGGTLTFDVQGDDPDSRSLSLTGSSITNNSPYNVGLYGSDIPSFTITFTTNGQTVTFSQGFLNGITLAGNKVLPDPSSSHVPDQTSAKNYSVSSNGNVITIQPQVRLNPGSSYTVTIPNASPVGSSVISVDGFGTTLTLNGINNNTEFATATNGSGIYTFTARGFSSNYSLIATSLWELGELNPKADNTLYEVGPLSGTSPGIDFIFNNAFADTTIVEHTFYGNYNVDGTAPTTDGTLKLVDSDWSIDGNVITITPNIRLISGSSYYITLRVYDLDDGGQPLPDFFNTTNISTYQRLVNWELAASVPGSPVAPSIVFNAKPTSGGGGGGGGGGGLAYLRIVGVDGGVESLVYTPPSGGNATISGDIYANKEYYLVFSGNIASTFAPSSGVGAAGPAFIAASGTGTQTAANTAAVRKYGSNIIGFQIKITDNVINHTSNASAKTDYEDGTGLAFTIDQVAARTSVTGVPGGFGIAPGLPGLNFSGAVTSDSAPRLEFNLTVHKQP